MDEKTTKTTKTTTVEPGREEKQTQTTRETTTRETTTREVPHEAPQRIEEVTVIEEDDD